MKVSRKIEKTQLSVRAMVKGCFSTGVELNGPQWGLTISVDRFIDFVAITHQVQFTDQTKRTIGRRLREEPEMLRYKIKSGQI